MQCAVGGEDPELLFSPDAETTSIMAFLVSSRSLQFFSRWGVCCCCCCCYRGAIQYTVTVIHTHTPRDIFETFPKNMKGVYFLDI